MEGKVMRMRQSQRLQSGATLLEFVLAAPVVMLLGMTTVQAALIYHGKTTLNYATFEAARTGAVNNAQLDAMKKELGIRLSPIQGGDGTLTSAAIAIAKSSARVMDPAGTHIKVLNPTTAAFADWGINSSESDRRVIPNSHLRHQEHTIGSESGLSLRDANLLKIEVTHGMDLKVPVVSGLIRKFMTLIDPENALFYHRNQFPLTSVATVRMQSEAWEDQIVLANLPATEGAEPGGSDYIGEPSDTAPLGDNEGELPAAECEGGDHGLGASPVLMDASAYEAGECGVANSGYGAAGGGVFGCG